MILILQIILSATSTNEALIPCPLFLFFIHILALSFSCFSLFSSCSLTLTLDGSRFALSDSAPLHSHLVTREILYRYSPICPTVGLLGCSSTQRCLSVSPGAGSRCWTFCLKLWSEKPCCWSHCFVSHE